MPVWAISAVLYGGIMLFAALTQPIRRRARAALAAVAYSAAAASALAVEPSLTLQLTLPGALLLSGYWLSGLLFGDPQPALEAWLLRTDRAVGAPWWMQRIPRALAELLEISYAADYVVVGGGAIYAAMAGVDAVEYYWGVVLTAELASFAPLPWLRSRPPRALEGEPGGRVRPVYARRLNLAVLNNASVQANTLPSGHVSGAVGAALGVMSFEPTTGWVLLAVAGVIGVAAVAGRYHYAVDCVAGAVVAVLVWSAM
jgi:membrane-associated phospholipid phosphatase